MRKFNRRYEQQKLCVTEFLQYQLELNIDPFAPTIHRTWPSGVAEFAIRPQLIRYRPRSPGFNGQKTSSEQRSVISKEPQENRDTKKTHVEVHAMFLQQTFQIKQATK